MLSFPDLPIADFTELDGYLAYQHPTLGPQRIRVQDLFDNIPRPRYSKILRIGSFGDSTANPGAHASPDTHDASVNTAAFPGTATTTSLAPSGSKYLLDTQYPRSHFVFNGGVSGDSTTAMLARDDAVASITRKSLSDMQNANVDVILFRGGSINDITAGSTEDAILSRHSQLLQRMMQTTAALIIDEGIAGYSVAGATADGYRAKLVSLNRKFKIYAERYPDRIVFLNPEGLTCDGTGLFITGMCRTDNLHLSWYGQYTVARAEAAILTKHFGPSRGPRFEGINLLSNALMNATTVPGSYGTVATGFSITGTNATRQNAQVENFDGQLWQTCEFVPTAADAAGAILMPYTPASSGYGILKGDFVGVEFDWFVEGNGFDVAPPTPDSWYARFDNTQTGTSGRVVLQRLTPDEFTAFPADAGRVRGRAVLGPFQFQDDSANMTAASNIAFNYRTDATTMFKIGVSQPRLVKIDMGTECLNEEMRAVLASGSATSLTTATAKNITSLALPIGTWDVQGVIDSVLAAATSTVFNASISTVSNTLSANQDETTTDLTALTTVTGTKRMATPVVRVHCFAPTTIYLVASNTFSAGAQTAYGSISAKRVFGRRNTT